MSDIVRGAALPSGTGPPVYDVIAPAIGEVWDLTCLDEYVFGVDCHWVVDPRTKHGRSRRCYKDEGDCAECDAKSRPLWLGWIGCVENARRKRVILRMGAESAKALAAILPRGHRPRGRRYNVRRNSAGATAQLAWELHRLEAETPLPRPHNLAPTICLVLGCESVPGYTFSLDEIRERGEA